MSVIKRLAGCVREYKGSTLATPLFTTGECLMEILIPWVMGILIDKGIYAGDMQAVLKYGAILLVLALLSLLVGALSGAFASVASVGFAKNLRQDMFHAVQNFSFSNIDKFSTASIVTRCTTDVTNIQNAFQMIIRIAVRCPVMLILSMVMALRINAELSLIFLIVLPVVALGLALIMTNAHPIFERVFRTYDRLNAIVQENLRGIRVVKSYVREDHEREKFNKVSQSIFKDFSSAERLLAFNMPLMQLAMYGCTIAISWLGAKLIAGGTMLVGDLTAMMSYSIQILMSLNMLGMIFVQITMARNSAERIVEILDEQPDLANPVHPITEVKDGSIDFDGVDFRYSEKAERLSLQDVDLHIRSGETIGIIGGTGSSKSSLVQLIPRLYDVTRGSVRVGGVDVRDYDIEALRQQVSMVLQKNVLFSGTIKENLRWGCKDASDEELVRMCRLAQADEFIQKFPDGYDTYLEEGGTNVSGGQKQRLCIARALLKKPKILILDDSTSAVDTHTDAMIRKAFLDEIPETTKLIIAQRISSVQDADRIVVMDNGRINDVGTHEELLARNEIYQQVYRSQVKGGDGNE